jgi:hypothetical protein
MLVRAKKLGYYNHKRVREGEEFILRKYKGLVQAKDTLKMVPKEFTPEEQFSSEWMERVSEDEPTPERREIVNKRKALRQSDDVI